MLKLGNFNVKRKKVVINQGKEIKKVKEREIK